MQDCSGEEQLVGGQQVVAGLLQQHQHQHHPRPGRHRLTDPQVSAFCRTLLPALMELTISKRYIESARSIFQTLAAIRPNIFLPPLLLRLDSGLDTLTEPHKFTVAVKCLSSMARSLVRPGPSCQAGPTYVVLLLTAVLPGIDSNDPHKIMLVF